MTEIHNREKVKNFWSYFLDALDLVVSGALIDTDLADPFFRLSKSDKRKARNKFRKKTGKNLPF